jgi:uncharacterized protein YbaA (DUF1428 family)
MSYIEGFVAAVPKANKEIYRRHAIDAAPMFEGATRMVEGWGDDVPKGKVTDFQGAVQARDDEQVVFSWIEYPDKATRDAANEKMRNDPRAAGKMGEMPFDGTRMIFGGFNPLVDEGTERGGYVDGFLVPVPGDKVDAYRDLAARAARIFREYGALRDVEAIGDDVPEGKVTDFFRAVKAEPGEKIFFSFVEWPDKAHRDEAWKKVMEDERMKPEGEMPFSGPRMIWAGFEPIVDTAGAPSTQSRPA